MEYPEFTRDLYEIYKSEVMGEALFNTAAALSVNQSRKQKWTALAELETQTKQRYLEHVGSEERYPYASKITGHLFGVLFAILPWKVSIKLLGDGTQPFMAVFCRLLEHASTEEVSFYDYVVAHEKAIAEFATLELQNDADPLQPVFQLLTPS